MKLSSLCEERLPTLQATLYGSTLSSVWSQDSMPHEGTRRSVSAPPVPFNAIQEVHDLNASSLEDMRSELLIPAGSVPHVPAGRNLKTPDWLYRSAGRHLKEHQDMIQRSVIHGQSQIALGSSPLASASPTWVVPAQPLSMSLPANVKEADIVGRATTAPGRRPSSDRGSPVPVQREQELNITGR